MSPWAMNVSQFECSPPLAFESVALSPVALSPVALSPVTLSPVTQPVIPHTDPKQALPPRPSPNIKLLAGPDYRSSSDAWDVRILVLYILFTQLYLHVCGHRRKSTTTSKVTINIRFFYLLSDLLATIALGKLSKVEKLSFEMSYIYSIWAPIILFCLGGPDTITVLDLQENYTWLRHLTGLVTLSLRTAYVLVVTWIDCLSLLAMPMLLSGIIKYGERVWIVRSRSKGQPGLFEISQPMVDEISSRKPPKVNLVIRAYSYFQTIKPHTINDDALDVNRLGNKAKDFYKWFGHLDDACNVFRLVEIELGFMYDALFSKIGSVFTLRGCIFRTVCFFCAVGELSWFFFIERNVLWLPETDVIITFVMLFGALTLEVAGLLAQFFSDWAIVWVCQHRIIWVRILVFQAHKIFRSKSKRWSERMGQFSFLKFCHKCKKTKYNGLTKLVCGRERILKKFSLPARDVQPCLERLIIDQLWDRSNIDHDSSQVQIFLSSMASKKGNWTLEKFKCFPDESIELDFGESILIWHIATDICCYHFEDPNVAVKDDVILATKTLSYYMMHLLLTSSSRFPICRWNDEKMQICFRVKKIFGNKISKSFDGKAYSELLLKETRDTGDETVKNIKKLAGSLIEEENRWEIMSKMWVEILCYAAISCPAKNHAEELRQGGEFLTHVWLLLMHFGITKKRVEFGWPLQPDETNERAGGDLV